MSPPSPSSNCNERLRLLGLAFIAIMANASYTTIAPILPLEMDKYNISEVYVSIIFLAFTFGSLLAPALFAKYFESLGRINIISYSMVGMSIMFGCLGYVFDMASIATSARNTSDNGNDNSHNEVVVATLLFFIQLSLGAFYAMITTGYYSLASLAFVEKESAMSVLESSVGIGHIVGPIVGAVLYDEWGFQFVYMNGVALSMLLAAFASWKLLVPLFESKDPDAAVDDTELDGECCRSVDSTNRTISPHDDDCDDVEYVQCVSPTGYQSLSIQSSDIDAPSQLSAMSLLKFPNILLAAFSICWVMVAWAFLEPLLAKQLDSNFNVGNKGIGIIFSLTSIIYVPATLLVQYIPGSIERRTTISISLVLTPIAVLFVGSNSLQLVILGVGLLGLLPAPVWVMLLPWMQEEAAMVFPHPDTKLYANDLTASIYNSFMTLGKVLGYGIGSLLGSKGFTRTTQMVALLVFVHSIVFYFGTRERKNEGNTRGVESKTRTSVSSIEHISALMQ
jgi:MFS family permease